MSEKKEIVTSLTLGDSFSKKINELVEKIEKDKNSKQKN